MTKRKDIRLTLNPSDQKAFNEAKKKAEIELGYTLRDNEFAVRVLAHAVKKHKQ